MRAAAITLSIPLAVLIALPATAAATPQDLFGFGTRSPALAMTGVAFSEGAEASFLNPAGLSRVRRRSISLGFSAAAYSVNLDGDRFPIEAPRGSTIGFCLPLPFGGFLRDRLVLGGGFYTPVGVLLRGVVAYPDVPQFPVLDRVQVVAVQFGAGMDLSGWVDGLRVGVGISALADLTGDVLVRLNQENQFVSELETQLLSTFGPILGVSYDNGRFGVGAVWRSELMSHMGLDVQATDLPVEVPPLTVGGLVQYDPHTVAVEGVWHATDDLLLVAHATVRFWSGWPGPQQKTTMSSDLAPAPELSTVVSPRVAVEHTVRDTRFEMRLRAGYAFEPSPAPPARDATVRDRDGRPRVEGGVPVQIPLRYLDNDRHVFTAGIGIVRPVGDGARVTFDIYGQAHVLAPRDHDVARTDGAQPMRTTGLVLAGGWSLGLEF